LIVNAKTMFMYPAPKKRKTIAIAVATHGATRARMLISHSSAATHTWRTIPTAWYAL
jgi:hypothetical protein